DAPASALQTTPVSSRQVALPAQQVESRLGGAAAVDRGVAVRPVGERRDDVGTDQPDGSFDVIGIAAVADDRQAPCRLSVLACLFSLVAGPRPQVAGTGDLF